MERKIIFAIITSLYVVSSQSSLQNWFDSKIYTFAFPGIEPGSTFNGTHLIGPRVELMKEVCCRANKRCDSALVDFIRCWNDNNQSDVLNGRWYDACIQLSTIKRRTVSYAFSEITFLDVPNPAVVVRRNSNVTLDDLKNPRNEMKLALMSVPELGTAGVLNVFRKFFFIQPENVISLKRGAGNDVTSEILRLINDPCSGVDLGIVVTALAKKNDPFKILFELPVDLGQSTVMVRKDDQSILEWWDYALRKFMCSKDYKKFCKKMDQMFGANDLNCPDPKQVNCEHDCEIRMRVPVCSGCVTEEDKKKKDKDDEEETTTTTTTTETITSTEEQTTNKPLTTTTTTSEELSSTSETSTTSSKVIPESTSSIEPTSTSPITTTQSTSEEITSTSKIITSTVPEEGNGNGEMTPTATDKATTTEEVQSSVTATDKATTTEEVQSSVTTTDKATTTEEVQSTVTIPPSTTSTTTESVKETSSSSTTNIPKSTSNIHTSKVTSTEEMSSSTLTVSSTSEELGTTVTPQPTEDQSSTYPKTTEPIATTKISVQSTEDDLDKSGTDEGNSDIGSKKQKVVRVVTISETDSQTDADSGNDSVTIAMTTATRRRKRRNAF